MDKYIERIAHTLNIKYNQVDAVVSMFGEGATVPFISRYRKERTGGLDEVIIRDIELLNKKFDELKKRKIKINSRFSNLS